MESIVATDDQTLNAAMTELEAWGGNPESRPDQPAAQTSASATEPPAPATEAAIETDPQAKTKTGTPKTEAVSPKTVESTPEAKPESKPTVSKYQKEQARRYGSWDELNKSKAEFATLQQAYKEKEAIIAQREQQLARREAALSAPKHPPEAFEARATELEANALRVGQEIQRLEAAGEYDKAERLKEQQNPDYLTRKAKEFREHAAELRANPPKPDQTFEQEQARFKQEQQHWWGKAAGEFPAVAREGTPERNALIQLLKTEPGIANDPKGMYYASRLVTAEASALRVPTLVKDLEKAQARVKELEEITSVPADGSVPASSQSPKSFDQMNYAERLAVVEAEARAMSY